MLRVLDHDLPTERLSRKSIALRTHPTAAIGMKDGRNDEASSAVFDPGAPDAAAYR